MFDSDQYTLEEIIRGFAYDQDDKSYRCLFCDRVFYETEVYPVDGRFFTAETAIKAHINSVHADRISELIHSDSKYLSLTDNQKDLLASFSLGLSDKEIAAKLGVSPSTVRHQKFMFKEKARAAKMYLALWEMVVKQMEQSKNPEKKILIPIHDHATMVDDRYVITEEENEQILRNAFISLEPLVLKHFPVKEKKKIAILRKIAAEFVKNRQYSEKEINAILKPVFADYVTIRRYLIEYGYMDRTRDCSAYWLK